MKVHELLEAIVESKSAPLYHATSLFRAAQILKANTLVAKTDQRINGKEVMGVSFTRNLQFAKTFDNVMDHSRIIFVVDQNKLAQRHKILPIDYFTTHPNAKEVIDGEFDDEKKVHVRRQGPWAESEELVIGDIKNFMNYVTKIIVTKECQNWTWTKMMLPDGQPNSTLGAGDWVERYKFVSENPKAVLE